jgi:transposase
LVFIDECGSNMALTPVYARAPRGERARANVRTAIEAKGCQLLFLPSYSPDLTPIEEAFSKLKTALRRAGARTREALEEAIGQALLTITAKARTWVVSALRVSSSWAREEELIWFKL